MLILAHRGLAGPGRPENTLAAVEAAFASGADGVEVDLRLTADDVLALSHDADLQRLAGVPATVAISSWSELRSVASRGGLHLCRLEELLAVAAGRRMVLEAKKPPPSRGAEDRTARALVARLNAWHAAGVAEDITVSSFGVALLRRIRGLLGPESTVRTALLGNPCHSARWVLRQALNDGHDEVHLHVSSALCQTAAIEAAHEAGVTVVPWTVNSSRDVQQLHRAGADGVITDVPGVARAALLPAHV